MSISDNITVQQLRGLFNEGTVPVVVDVREAHELQSLPFEGGTALHIPLGQMAGRLGELPLHTPLYVLCRSGARSATAQNILLSAGFHPVYNIMGGVLAWVTSGREA